MPPILCFLKYIIARTSAGSCRRRQAMKLECSVLWSWRPVQLVTDRCNCGNPSRHTASSGGFRPRRTVRSEATVEYWCLHRSGPNTAMQTIPVKVALPNLLRGHRKRAQRRRFASARENAATPPSRHSDAIRMPKSCRSRIWATCIDVDVPTRHAETAVLIS